MKKFLTTAGVTVLAIGFYAATAKSDNGKTLKGVMQDLSLNLNLVHDGIMTENYGAIEVAARKIANHPKPTNMGSIMGIVGVSNLPSFKAHDTEVHDLAMAVSDAAKAKDLGKIVLNTNKLVNSCVRCHQGFRDKVVQGLKSNK
jgi:hypothetical protein